MNKIEIQKPMNPPKFKIMTIIMSIRKLFRNTDDEVRYVGIKTDFHVLDFGCGLGFNTISAAKIVGAEGKVFALDISRQAIETVKKKAQKNKLENIETILSVCETGLGNNTVDVVYLHNTLPMVKNKKEVLDEIHRVLKLNGKMSYMSRSVSRIAGENSMSNEQLKEYLEIENKFRLIKSKKGHFIFEKLK